MFLKMNFFFILSITNRMPQKMDKNELLNISPNSKKMKDYKASLSSLNSKQWEACIGLMLGDASIQTQNKGKTFRLKFEWSNKSLPYIKHVYNLMGAWVISPPHKKERISPKGNIVINWGFQTISHEVFNNLADLFISSNKKSISLNLIKNHLTPIGLAYWFMDDGGKLDYNIGTKNRSLVLNTQSFKDEQVNILCKELNDKFDLGCSIRSNKGKKIIIISNYDTFVKLTKGHIIKEMEYKLTFSI